MSLIKKDHIHNDWANHSKHNESHYIIYATKFEMVHRLEYGLEMSILIV